MKLKKQKEKIAALVQTCTKLGKIALAVAVDYAAAIAVVVVLGLCALKLPEAHNKFLHYKVGKKVYTIRDNDKSGGGTGFAIKAPSGQTYILTNDHVCGVSSDKQTVLVTGDEGSMRRRIIAHDENSDLCLVEGMPGVEGLGLSGSEPSRADSGYVVGHPRLMPTHVSHGEITAKEDVSILVGPISYINPDNGQEVIVPVEDGGIPANQCTMNKFSQQNVDIDFMFFIIKVKFCVLTVNDAYVTGITIHPGNSGSPMVNFWGNVQGVAFASDSTNWGRIVPIQDVKAFLKNY